ncbi:hypothetical protein [Sphaerochaeta globosa]|uniref:Uncharacterized protein n=1 Tax=Sphaerochaeta globosa (strain ATCC BAA-1886 / DSM 22777 / Buddy) TaxID=158189 RepID=F0RT40_SPHGB|nr:hypothetical protein [Sphaerochaeta globosa]ADY14486.1 hypothetical protein SpiBuddy_2675 [Sphaerochaeta globosa str. Buddy]
MSDILILITIYVVAAALGGIGLYFLLTHHTSKPHKHERPNKQATISTEDMLPGWGKEEEESKR